MTLARIPLGIRLLALLAALATATDVSAFSLPTNDGFVTDAADILEEAKEADLEQFLRETSKLTGVQTALVTIRSSEQGSVETFSDEMLQKWRIGANTGGKGVLLLYWYDSRTFYIATTPELEADLPRETLQKIVEKDVDPHLKEGMYEEAFSSALDAVFKHLSGAYSDERYREKSGGKLKVVFLFLLSVIFVSAAAHLGRKTKWWTGLAMGIVTGSLLALLTKQLLALPFLLVMGAIFDVVLTQHKAEYSRYGRRHRHPLRRRRR